MTYAIAVRALCEFTAKQGDLDLRFTPSPSAQEGIAGHTLVASRRASSYETEVSLSGEFGPLTVRGRADGFDPVQGQLEEVKTYRGRLDAIADNHRQLHWAQLKIYGWLLCQARGLTELKLALVYFHIDEQTETALVEQHSAADLQAFFNTHCQRFLVWAEQEMAHRQARQQALQALPFPHADFRPGQRQLAEAVYRSAAGRRRLLVQAPTGIGKTVGTVYPVLKAMAAQPIDKLYFLAAKTSGRGLALGALSLLEASLPDTAKLRVLELVARDKACEHPDKACHGESCPLARGFYDRLPAARSAAVASGRMDKDSLRRQALAHQVCPYYLSQDLVRWADVVVGDYNYYFDHSALLYALAQANDWRVSVLVDEAHNLVERGRQMYSAELGLSDLTLARHSAKAHAEVRRDLDRLRRQWQLLTQEQEADYQVHERVPPKLLGTMQQASASITAHLAENPTDVDPILQRFYFDLLHFINMAEVFGEHSLFDVTLLPESRAGQASPSRLCLRNVVPAPFLGPRLAAAHAAALFSATLNPWDYYLDLLGLPEDAICLDVESPFKAEQLQVRVARAVSTRWQHRERSLSALVDIMAGHYQERPGNYLAFFSSYAYLQQAADALAERHPNIPFNLQTSHMREADRDAFLARFKDGSASIGFAVLGGSFGEGIDLPGTQLIGAFIATLGMPQVNPVNEQISQRMGKLFGKGYNYTYLYPGLRKVVQAAGRVIRTTTDQGLVVLLDDRFARREVLALMPAWWDVGLD